MARPLGHIKPYLPMSSFTGMSSGKAEPLSIFSSAMWLRCEVFLVLEGVVGLLFVGVVGNVSRSSLVHASDVV